MQYSDLQACQAAGVPVWKSLGRHLAQHLVQRFLAEVLGEVWSASLAGMMLLPTPGRFCDGCLGSSLPEAMCAGNTLFSVLMTRRKGWSDAPTALQ